MYNIYTYQGQLKHKQESQFQDQNYTKWMLRHQQLKNRSVDHVKNRVSQFVKNQAQNPMVVEDDHYKTWRYQKQFRDIEDSAKFVGFKTFVHRPNYDVGKHFSQRQRKEINYLATKKKNLVQKKIIPHEQLSRSLRSQGPLNPKHTFRDKKPDKLLLQPRMRYTNITDKQRHNQTSITYDDKFQSIFRNYSLNKSKIGQARSSPLPFDKNNIDLMSSTFSECANKKKEKFYYEANNQEDQLVESVSKIQKSLSPEDEEHEKKRKMYFKTAKTMALKGDREAMEFMISTQYDRKKDLSNLNRNIQNESFIKRAIL